MSWDSETPHNALPFLPPARDVETKAVLKATISARDALARFDARAQALPDPRILINVIPVLEAQASSEIENIVTTTDDLFAALATDRGDPAAREALRYRSALARGSDLVRARPITSRTAEEICNHIRGNDAGLRKGEVYIGDPHSQQRIYTPPSDENIIRDLLENWTQYVNSKDDTDPLIKMAVAHYQFEAIHPFSDGNGRTGRILNVLMLCDAGLLHMPLLYLSRYIIETKHEYYRLLLAVTEDEAWESWLLYLLEGVRATSLQTLDLIERINDVREDLIATARELFKAPNYDFVNLLMEKPYVRSQDVVERCEVSRPTAVKWLDELNRVRQLQEVRIGRSVVHIHLPLMDALR